MDGKITPTDVELAELIESIDSRLIVTMMYTANNQVYVLIPYYVDVQTAKELILLTIEEYFKEQLFFDVDDFQVYDATSLDISWIRE